MSPADHARHDSMMAAWPRFPGKGKLSDFRLALAPRPATLYYSTWGPHAVLTGRD